MQQMKSGRHDLVVDVTQWVILRLVDRLETVVHRTWMIKQHTSASHAYAHALRYDAL
jgi:hypothetical protein